MTWPSLERERALWEAGAAAVAGIDEAGRGSLVGSVVAAAVVLPPGVSIEGVRDSKLLSRRRRESLYEVIVREAVAWSVGEVDAATIDALNIKRAARLAMRRAVEGLALVPDHLLVDAETVPSCDVPQTSIVHGDALCHSIAAASIVAKVTRDRLCEAWHERYPQYNIRSHKGYCTREHVLAILENGPCPLHRRTFLTRVLSRNPATPAPIGLDI